MGNAVFTQPNPFKAKTEDIDDLVPSLKPRVDTGSLLSDYTTISYDTHHGEIYNEKFVRRPISGIAIKPNTHAYFQVVRSDSSVVKVFNEIGAVGPRPKSVRKGPKGNPVVVDQDKAQDKYWTDWFLQSVRETRQEKVQIVETFGEPVFYAYGERPRFLQFQGYLVNTSDFNWRAEFWENWDKFFRATKLVEQDAQLFIGFDDIVVSGYPISASANQSANDPHLITFSFSFYVSSYINMTMQNVGSLQSLRGGAAEQLGVQTSRTSEFLKAGSFGHELMQNEVFTSNLAKIIGGQNLAFAEFWKRTFGHLGSVDVPLGGGLTANSLDIFNSNLRYIKGAKTAAEVLLSYMNRQASQLAFRKAEEVTNFLPGGQRTANHFFGLTSHLYRVLAVNAIGLGADASQWTKLLNNINQMGNAAGIAVQMAYAATTAAGAALYSQTNRFELSDLEYDSSLGLVAKGQDAGFGKALTNSSLKDTAQNPHQITKNSRKAVTQTSESKSGTWGASETTGLTWDTDPVPFVTAEPIGDSHFTEQLDTSEWEQSAIDLQREYIQLRHGAMSWIDFEEDAEEDGS